MNHIPQVESGPRRLLTTTLLVLCALVCLLVAPARAANVVYTTYTLPAALTASPFNCTLVNGTYECGSIDLDKDANLSLTTDVYIWVRNGSFSSQKNLNTINNGHTLSLAVDLNVSMKKDTDIDMDIVASGSISFAKDARIDGNITSSVDVTFAKDSTINGNLVVSRDLTGAKNVVVNGTCQVGRTKTNITCTGGSVALHHVRATFTPSTTACVGPSVTIYACNSQDNSSGSCTAYTGGISGTLEAESDSDVALSSVAFNIGSGSSSTTVTLPAITTPQTAYLTFSGLSKTTTASGTCWDGSSNSCELVVSSCMDHVRLDHAGSGVACVPAAVTVNACSSSDSSGNCTASTSGISGTVYAKSSAGATLGSAAFSIASGQSAQTVSVPVTSIGTATFSVGGLSITPTNSTTCWNGSAASCDYLSSDLGFVFDIPNHRAAVDQSDLVFKAVKTSGANNTCVSALPDKTYAVNFSCNYQNPANPSNTSAPVVITSATSASLTCAGASAAASASPVSIAFTNGIGKIKASYADAAQIKVYATLTDSGAGTVTGNDTFVAAPAKFTISTSDTALKADGGFSATVTAVNNNGVVTPNFGQESNGHRATVTFSQCGGSNQGAFSGNLTNGVASMPAFVAGVSTQSGLKFSEVGTLDATATMTNMDYSATLGFQTPDSTLAVTGTTNTASGSGCSGSFGKFTPYYLKTELVPDTTKFAYSGVAFKVKVIGMNASDQITQNYATASYANNVTLSAVDASGSSVASVGALSPTTVNGAEFVQGGYATPSITFTFPTVTGGVNAAKQAPKTIYLRAVEANPGTAKSYISTSASSYEAKVEMRLGRLRLFNAYSSSLSTVKMPVQAEYWNGSVWVVNGDDSVTRLTSGSIGFPTSPTPTVTATYTGSYLQLTAGKGTLTIGSTTKAKGYAYVTANLGALTDASNACTGAATGTSGASLSGLRSYYGCDTAGVAAGSYSYDPSARANFGNQSQETKGVVHVREVFN